MSAVRLTKSAVEKAISSGNKADVRDSGARGLVLRVWGPGKWAWNLRRSVNGKDYRLDMGDLWTLDEARDLAGEADRLIRAKAAGVFELAPARGRAPLPAWYAKRMRAKRGDPEPEKPVQKPVVAPSMTYNRAREVYLEEVERTRRPSTVVSYRSCLSIAEMKRFEGRMVRDISRQEMAEAVADVSRRAERQAETTVIAVRGLFRYLGRDDMTGRTGVEGGRMKDLSAPERTLVEDAPATASRHIPDGAEIGAIMRKMRYTDSPVPQRDRLAVELLVYSAQRRRMVASARVQDFEFLPDGSCLWNIPPLHRKTASMRLRATGEDVGDHVVPLPPSAAVVVRRAVNLAAGRRYLFPATRDRRSGQRSEHMSGETLTHLLADLGFEASPHDLRRALATTYLVRFKKMTKAQAKPLAKEILDHAEGDERDVTTEHYLLESGTHSKWETMRGWCAWVDAQIG